MQVGFRLIGLCCAIGMLFVASVSLAQSQRRGNVSVDEDPLEDKLPPGIKVRAFIHRPRVVEPNHLGQCTTTTNDNAPTFGLTGWQLPAGGVTWKLSGATIPGNIGSSAARSAISNAFAAWHAIDTQKIFIDGGSTNAKTTRFDGTNAILWKRLNASTIGVTYVWYYTATGIVAEVDTAFNSRYPWAIFDLNAGECQPSPDAYDLQNIATHEFGHWIGLEDLYGDGDKDLTMYGFGAGGELKKQSLGQGDIDGATTAAP